MGLYFWIISQVTYRHWLYQLYRHLKITKNMYMYITHGQKPPRAMYRTTQ